MAMNIGIFVPVSTNSRTIDRFQELRPSYRVDGEAAAAAVGRDGRVAGDGRQREDGRSLGGLLVFSEPGDDGDVGG